MFHTIHSERGNALERKDFQSHTGPGKKFLHHVRRNLIIQARVRHVDDNGVNPVKALSSSRLVRSKMLPLGDDLFKGEIDDSTLSRLNDVGSRPIRAAEIMTAGLRMQLQDLSSGGQLAAKPALVPDALAARQQPALAASLPGAKGKPRAGVGGNVWMTIFNAKRRAAKLANGDRPLSKVQLLSVREASHIEVNDASAVGGDRWARWVELFGSEF